MKAASLQNTGKMPLGILGLTQLPTFKEDELKFTR